MSRSLPLPSLRGPGPRVIGAGGRQTDGAVGVPDVVRALVDRLRGPIRDEVRGVAEAGNWHVPDDDGDAASQAVRPWRAVLDVVGDGIRLTDAGFLPVAAVEQVLTRSGRRERWHSAASREAMTPVAQIRRQTQEFGLVARSRGRLVPTSAARGLTDDRVLLTHVLAAMPPLGEVGGRVAIDAQAVHLLAAAAGPNPGGRRIFDVSTFVAEVMHHLGHVVDADAAWRFTGSLELLLDLLAPVDRPAFARALLRRGARA